MVKKAFTMAEVLITLGIIGIVAAMTLPALIGNYQKKVTATRLKRSYTVIAQTIERSKVDYGDVSGWRLDEIAGSAQANRDYITEYFTQVNFGIRGCRRFKVRFMVQQKSLVII